MVQHTFCRPNKLATHWILYTNHVYYLLVLANLLFIVHQAQIFICVFLFVLPERLWTATAQIFVLNLRLVVGNQF
jgi:hypothetical protein